MSYSIRRLTGEDVDAYRAIRLEALTNHPEAYGQSAENFAAQPLADVVRLLDNLAVYGAITDAGELAAIMAYARDDGEREQHRGWLLQVYVKPMLRGSGCAEALIDRIVTHAQDEVLQLHLMVGSYNLPAIRLYEKAGFATYGTDPRCMKVNGRYIDEHMMVRFLDEAPGKNEND